MRSEVKIIQEVSRKLFRTAFIIFLSLLFLMAFEVIIKEKKNHYDSMTFRMMNLSWEKIYAWSLFECIIQSKFIKISQHKLHENMEKITAEFNLIFLANAL